jgi:hypothetical protein
MAHDTQQEPQKRGPKPKQLEPFERMGIPVGRDNTHIDPEEVEKLAALGVTTTEMADFFGVKEQTLRYNFSDNIQKGRSVLKISLRRSMLHNANQNMNAAVQIFLAKAILGLSENPLQSEDNKVLPWQESLTEVEPDVQVQIGKTATLQARVD